MTRLHWACALLLAAAFLFPLHVLPWMSWHNEVPAAAALLLAAWGALALSWKRRPAALAVPATGIVPIALAAVAAVQFATGRIEFGGTAWTVAFYCVGALIAMVLGAQLAQGNGERLREALETLARLLIALGLVQVALVFAQTFALWGGSELVARIDYRTRGGANVAQPNQAALVFVWAMAAAAWLALQGRIGRVPAAAVLVALAVGFATTESRSGLVGLLAVAGWLLARRRTWPQARLATWAPAYAALVLACFSAWPRIASAAWLLAEDKAVNLTTSGRTVMWRQFWEAVQLHPWFGWGLMEVGEAQTSIAHRFDAMMAATFSHNLLLDLALWIGIPGAVLIAAAAAWWLLGQLRAAASPAAIFALALVLPMATQSFTEFPYAYAYFLFPACLLVGALAALHGPALLQVPLPRALAAGGLALVTGLYAWSALEYVRLEEDFRSARFQALRIGPDQPQLAQDVTLLTQLGALVASTRLQPRPGMPPAELALLEGAARQYPWGATNFRAALGLALNGRLPEARRRMRVVRAYVPEETYRGLQGLIDEMALAHPVLVQLREP